MIKASKHIKLSLSLATLFFITPSIASEIKPFLGVGVGYQLADDDTYSASRPSGGIYNIYGGLQFNPNWSWDLGYQYHSELHAKATQIDVQTNFINSAVRYDWYRNQELSLFGRVGLSYWDMDKRLPASKIRENGISPLLEAGLAYHFADSLAFNLTYQYIHSIGNHRSGEYDSHAVMAKLTYHFWR